MIPSSVRIFVCSEAQDMRRSFDTLSLVVKQYFGQDPNSGALFCFVNKRRNGLKILWYDGNGQCILYKRVHSARFILPIANGAVAKEDEHEAMETETRTEQEGTTAVEAIEKNEEIIFVFEGPPSRDIR
ncbi:MAG: IS66 family insertion sequence element accessory protein TnpB [Deltaproteobacteria bacterium]|nr:IS66 family insertion sequence element accessory protein TnpB [Deltaproteobacteria bacterium]